ncbi:MAG: peptidase S8 [Deltaproteobacteria bacterium]|nr:MAG: peptidase S8 [Deltaproteobacteria bacterium]
MKPATRTVAVLGLIGVAMYAFRPAPAVRELPQPEAVSVPAAPGTLVVDLVDGASAADRDGVAALLGAELDWVHPLAADEALAVGDVADLAAAIAMLDGNPLVEVAEPVMEMTLPPQPSVDEALDLAPMAGFPNDPLYAKQWHLDAMGAPEGWARTPRGRGVIVAVVDTGVKVVEDLEGTKVLEGKSFVLGESSPVDGNGHGTHVAGTIAQTTNNGVGAAGVAPEATILPVKVLSRFGSGMSPWIAAGIDYAVDEGADVINLSLGGSYSRVIHTAIQKARAKGVVVVAAAGNTGRRGVSYPGALEESIGVGATGPGGAIAPYSSYGKGVDISAPGGDKRKPGGGVWQDTIDGTGHAYKEFQGTSMATPHVAGAAAVLLSTGSCDADCVERTLLDTARGQGWDEKFGHGQLDLGAALSQTTDRRGGLGFLIGGLMALLIGNLARSSAGFTRTAGAVGAVAAGGLFFLPRIGLFGLLGELLSQPFLAWPNVLLGPGWASFPLWLSAALPAAVAFVLGASRAGRPVALGFCAGVGAHLLHAAATGALSPSWMPGFMQGPWLAIHGAICLGLAMALAGAEKLDHKERR